MNMKTSLMRQKISVYTHNQRVTEHSGFIKKPFIAPMRIYFFQTSDDIIVQSYKKRMKRCQDWKFAYSCVSSNERLVFFSRGKIQADSVII